MYELKNEVYFKASRMDLISLIPKNSENKILEVGMGGGNTLLTIKELNLAAEVVGVELMKLDNSEQQNPKIDRVIFGNLEEIELDLENDYFDVILCGDILEHLINPWKVLEKLRKHLKLNGLLIVSIPNFREIRNVYSIFFKANFKYTERGTLDKTHLRFFCKKNMLELLESTNYTVIFINSNFNLRKEQWKRRFFNKFTLNLFSDFLTLQYILVAQKISV